MQHTSAILVTVDDEGMVSLGGEVIGWSVMAYSKPQQVIDNVVRVLADFVREKLELPEKNPNYD